MATGSSSRARSRAARDRGSLARARLYLVTPVRLDLEGFLEAAVGGGVDLVQVRESGLTDSELLPALERVRATTERLDIPFVVNDRPDLALLSGADYVHLGQEDLPVEAARRLGLGVGLSTHAPGEVDRAEADYIGVGPVFATPTKAGRPPVGLELVRYAAAHARQPWFAIGGIDATNVAQVVAAGARRISVVRAVGDAADPERAARELRSALPGQ